MVRRRWPLIPLAIAASVAASPAQAGEKARMNLSPTGIEARARGKAIVTIDRGSAGRFEVSVQRLAGETDYDLIVGGIKVLTLQTRRGGSAKACFRTAPRGSDAVLGFVSAPSTTTTRLGNFVGFCARHAIEHLDCFETAKL